MGTPSFRSHVEGKVKRWRPTDTLPGMAQPVSCHLPLPHSGHDTQHQYTSPDSLTKLWGSSRHLSLIPSPS